MKQTMGRHGTDYSPWVSLFLVLMLSVIVGSGAPQHARRPAPVEDTGPVSVMHSATLQVPIASDAVTLFGYLSDQRKLTAWLSEQAILEPQFGGKYHLRWKNAEPVDGLVTEYLAANTLGLTWRHPSDVAETQVRFRLSPQMGQTLVALELGGYASSATLDKAVKSWVFNLQNLKSVVETQVDLRQAARETTTRSAPRARRKM